ncbi:MAG: RimK/LysX family protein [Flavobacteriaceae bacterium]
MKQTIGRIDKADFPELGLIDIAVKIDTGAYTSSIHCQNVKEEAGVLKCNFLDKEHPAYDGKEFCFKDYKIKNVKSSNGTVQTRYMIQTTVTLFGEEHTIQLTLSDREEMKFPVLLGRKFLNKKFIVDTGLTNLSFKQQTNNEY